jgi:hypothetical protein
MQLAALMAMVAARLQICTAAWQPQYLQIQFAGTVVYFRSSRALSPLPDATTT